MKTAQHFIDSIIRATCGFVFVLFGYTLSAAADTSRNSWAPSLALDQAPDENVIRDLARATSELAGLAKPLGLIGANDVMFGNQGRLIETLLRDAGWLEVGSVPTWSPTAKDWAEHTLSKLVEPTSTAAAQEKAVAEAFQTLSNLPAVAIGRMQQRRKLAAYLFDQIRLNPFRSGSEGGQPGTVAAALDAVTVFGRASARWRLELSQPEQSGPKSTARTPEEIKGFSTQLERSMIKLVDAPEFVAAKEHLHLLPEELTRILTDALDATNELRRHPDDRRDELFQRAWNRWLEAAALTERLQAIRFGALLQDDASLAPILLKSPERATEIADLAQNWRAITSSDPLTRFQDFVAEEADAWTDVKVLLRGLKETGGIAFLRSLGQAIKAGNSGPGVGTVVLLETQSSGPSGRWASDAQIALAIRTALAGVVEKEWRAYFQAERWNVALAELERDDTLENSAVHVVSPALLTLARETALQAVRIWSLQAFVRRGNASLALRSASGETHVHLAIQSGPPKLALRNDRLVISWRPRIVFVVPEAKGGVHTGEMGVMMKSPIEIEIGNASVSHSPTMLIDAVSEYSTADGALAQQWAQMGATAFNGEMWIVEKDRWSRMIGEVCGLPISLIPDRLQLARDNNGAGELRTEFGPSGDKSLTVRFTVSHPDPSSQGPAGEFVFSLSGANATDGSVELNLRQSEALGAHLMQRLFASGVEDQLRQLLVAGLEATLPRSLVSAETLASQVKDRLAMSSNWAVGGKLAVRLSWTGGDTQESVSLAGVAVNAEAEIENPFQSHTLEDALRNPPKVVLKPVRPDLPASMWLRRVLGALPFLHIGAPDDMDRFRLSLIDPKTKALRAGLGYLRLDEGVTPMELKDPAQISFQADSVETIVLPGDISFHADPLAPVTGVIANNAIRLQGVMRLPHGLGEVRTVLRISAADSIQFQIDEPQGLAKALKARLRSLGALPETAELTNIELTPFGLALKLGGPIDLALKVQLDAALNPINGNVEEQIERASKAWLASQAKTVIRGGAASVMEYLESTRREYLTSLRTGPVTLGPGIHLAYLIEGAGVKGQLLIEALGEDGVPAKVAVIEANVGEKAKATIDSEDGARIERWLRSRLAVPSTFDGLQGFKISLQTQKAGIAIADGVIRVRIPLAISVAGVERAVGKSAIVINTQKPVPELEQVETVLAEVLRDLAMQQLQDSFAQLKLGGAEESLEKLIRDTDDVLKNAIPDLPGLSVIDSKPLHEELPPELRRVRQLLARLPEGADASADRAKRMLESIPSGYSFAIKFPFDTRSITITGLRLNFFGDNAGFDLRQANTDELTREVRDIVSRALGTTEGKARAAASTVLGAVKAGRKDINVAIRWAIPIEALGENVTEEIGIRFSLQGGVQFDEPDWSNAILGRVAAHLGRRLKGQEITLPLAEAKAAIREVTAESGCVVVEGDIIVETGGALKRITTGFTLSLPVLSRADPSSVRFRVNPLGDSIMKTAVETAMGALLKGVGADFLGNMDAFEVKKTYEPMYRVAGGQSIPHGIRVRLMVTMKLSGMDGFGISVPDLLIDAQGVRFGGMSVLSLSLPDKMAPYIPLAPPPVVLVLDKGEIGKFEHLRNGRLEKVYELAILGDAAVLGTNDLVKIHGRFAMELDQPGNFSAKGQLLVLSSIDLATAKVRIALKEGTLEGNLDIGGPVSSYLSGTGNILVNRAGLYSHANLRILGLITSDANVVVDNATERVLLDVRHKVIEPEVDFRFDSGPRFSNPELSGNLALTIGGVDLSAMNLNQNRSRLKSTFSVLGFRMRFVVPSLDPKHLNKGMLWDLIKNLLSPDFKNLDKALQALLKGNVTLNPFAGFGPGGDGFDSGSGQGGDGNEEGGTEDGGGGRADARNVGTVSGESTIAGDVQPDQAGDPGISGGTSMGDTVRQGKPGEPAFVFRADAERLYFVPNSELVKVANWPNIKADEALPIWAPVSGEYPLRRQSVAGWRPTGIVVSGGVVPAWTLRSRNEELTAPTGVEKKLSWIAQAQPIKSGELRGWVTVLALGDQEYARQGWVNTTNLGWGTDPKSLNSSALRKYAVDSCFDAVALHMSATPKRRWPGERPVNCPAPIVAYEVTRYPWAVTRAHQNAAPDPTMTPAGEKIEAVIARFPYENFYRVFVVRQAEQAPEYSQILLPDIGALLPGGANESPEEVGRIIRKHLQNPTTIPDHIGDWLDDTKRQWDTEHANKEEPQHAKVNPSLDIPLDGTAVESIKLRSSGPTVKAFKESEEVVRLEFGGQTRYVPMRLRFEGKEYTLFKTSPPNQFRSAGAGLMGSEGLGILLDSALVIVPLSERSTFKSQGRILVFPPGWKLDEVNRALLVATLDREIEEPHPLGRIEALLNHFQQFTAKGRIFEAASTELTPNGDLHVWSDVTPEDEGTDLKWRMLVAQSVTSKTAIVGQPAESRVYTSEIIIKGPAAAVEMARLNDLLKVGALKLGLNQGGDERRSLKLRKEGASGILWFNTGYAELWRAEGDVIKYSRIGPIQKLMTSESSRVDISSDSPLLNLLGQNLGSRLGAHPLTWNPTIDRTEEPSPSVKYVETWPLTDTPGDLSAIMVAPDIVDSNAPQVTLETTALIRTISKTEAPHREPVIVVTRIYSPDGRKKRVRSVVVPAVDVSVEVAGPPSEGGDSTKIAVGPRLMFSLSVQIPKADLVRQEKTRAIVASISRTLDPFWAEYSNAPQNSPDTPLIALGKVTLRMIDFDERSSLVLSPSFTNEFIRRKVRDPSMPLPVSMGSKLNIVMRAGPVETWVENWSAAESHIVLDSPGHREAFLSLLIGWWQQSEIRENWRSQTDKSAFFSCPQILDTDVIAVQRFDDPISTFLAVKGGAKHLLIANEDVRTDPAIAVELVRQHGFNGRLRIIRSTRNEPVGFWTSAGLYAYAKLGDRPVLVCRSVDEPFQPVQHRLLSYIIEASKAEPGYFLERVVRFAPGADGGECALSWSETSSSRPPLACFADGAILEITSESAGENPDHTFKDASRSDGWLELARVFPRRAGTTTVAWQRITRIVGNAPYYVGPQNLVRMKSAAAAEIVVTYPRIDRPPVAFLANVADQVLEREYESQDAPFKTLNLSYLESDPADAVASTARRTEGMEYFVLAGGKTHWLWIDPGAAELRSLTHPIDATATATWLNSGGRRLLKALAFETAQGQLARASLGKFGYPTPFLVWEFGTAESFQYFVVCPPRTPIEFAPSAAAGWTGTQGIWERVASLNAPYIVFGLGAPEGRSTQPGVLIGTAAPRRALTRAFEQSFGENRRILAVEKVWNVTRSDESFSLVAFRDSPAAIMSRSRRGNEVTWRWRALAQGEPQTIVQHQVLREDRDAAAALDEWLDPASDEIDGATWWLTRLSSGQLLRARFPMSPSHSDASSGLPTFSAVDSSPRDMVTQPTAPATVTGALHLRVGEAWAERSPLPAIWGGSLEAGDATANDAVLLLGRALTQSKAKADAVGAWLQGKHRLLWLIEHANPDAIKLIVGEDSRVLQSAETRFLEKLDDRWAMSNIASAKQLSIFAEPTSELLWRYVTANSEMGNVDLWIYPAERTASGSGATLMDSQQWGMWIRDRDENFRWQLVSRAKLGSPALAKPKTLFSGKASASSVMREQGPIGRPELWWQVMKIAGEDALSTWRFDPQDRAAALTTTRRRELGDAVFLFPQGNEWTNRPSADAWRTLWLRNTRHLSRTSVDTDPGTTEWDWNSVLDLEIVDQTVFHSQLSSRELLSVGAPEQTVGVLALGKTGDTSGDRMLSILGRATGTNNWRVLGSIAKADLNENGETSVEGLPLAVKGTTTVAVSLASTDEHRLLSVAAREWLARLTTPPPATESLDSPLLEQLEIGRTAAQIGLIGRYKGDDRWNVWRNAGMYRVSLDQRGTVNLRDVGAVLTVEGLPSLVQRGTPETARDAVRKLASIQLPQQDPIEGVFLPGTGGGIGFLAETSGTGRLWGVERNGNIRQIGEGKALAGHPDQLALLRDLLFGGLLSQTASVTINGVELNGGHGTVVRNHPDFPRRIVVALPIPQNRTMLAVFPEVDVRSGGPSESTILNAILQEAKIAHTRGTRFAVYSLPDRTFFFLRDRELGIWNRDAGKFEPGGMIELEATKLFAQAPISIGSSALLSSLITEPKGDDSLAISGGPIPADFLSQPLGGTMQTFVDTLIKYPGTQIVNDLLLPEGFLARTTGGQALIFAPAWFSNEVRVFPSLSRLSKIVHAAAVSEHEEVNPALSEEDWFASWFRVRLPNGMASDALGTLLWPPTPP
jgi:hypothetical protein